jgi:hypothetical protein
MLSIQTETEKPIYSICDNVKKAIQEYLKEYNPMPHDYLFKSRKGINSPIDQKTAWRILKEAAETWVLQIPLELTH